jgi:hypothetical protein
MRKRAALPLVFLLPTLLCATASAAEKQEPPKQTTKNAALEQFKQLAGDWVGKNATHGEGGDGEMHVQYKVTSGGSTVVETMFPGTDHEMVTVIHPDGDSLMLTHYCMLGNQPRMKSEGTGDTKQIAFKFAGCSNMKSDKDMHMHEVTFTFIDKDTLKSEWTHYNDGKPAGNVTFTLHRKK